MKGKMSYFKLLCCLFISIFIFGFGGEIQAAENFGSRKQLAYRSGSWGSTYFQYIYRVSNNSDAYCLDHSKNGPYPGYFMSLQQQNVSLSDSIRKKIIAIINESNNLNMSDDGLKYYITQAAIWHVRNNYQFGVDGGEGITQGFYNWIISNYRSEWNQLMGAEYVEPSFSVKSSSSELVEEGDYYVSKKYEVSSSSIYSVQIDSGSSSGACILLDNHSECRTSWEGANTIDGFKVRVNKPAANTSGTLVVKFTVKPYNKMYKNDIDTFVGVDSSFNWQSVAVLTTTEKVYSKSFTLKRDYESAPVEVEVQKTDSETGRKVAGAVLAIIDTDSNSTVATYTSTAEGQANPVTKLDVGSYKLVEEQAPQGYTKSDEEVLFSVVKDGNTLKVKDSQNNFITGTPITISIKDMKHRIMFKKVDSNGNPIEGLIIKVIDYVQGSSRDQSAIDHAVLCAVTDRNGLLTQPCPGDMDTHNVNSNGIYTLGIDFGTDTSIYAIREYCDNDSCKIFAGPSSDGHNQENASIRWGIFAFHVTNGSVDLITNPYIRSTETSVHGVPLIEMVITNNYKLTIKKTDVTSGNEIAGAHLIVSDPTLQGDNVIDEWTSKEGKSHDFKNIEVGKKYRLTEEIAPEGYVKSLNSVKSATSIDFSMDKDGNVTTYDIDTGAVITDLKGTNYELIVKNMKTKTVFSKVSATTGEEIAGAHLKVCTSEKYMVADADGDGSKCDAIEEWISEAGKSHSIDALPAGRYYLVETIAPVGYYTKTSAVKFEVKDDGTITKVEMENELTKLVVSKKNQVTGERVAGAHMQILNASDRSVAKDYNGDEAVWVSKADEDWTIFGLPIGEYILVETIVPEGFQEGMIVDGKNVNEYKFSIEDEEDDLYLGTYVEVMNAPNTGISTLNLFAIGGLMIFAGYETIKIYRRKALN